MLSNFDVGPGFYVIVGTLFGIIIGWLIGFFDSNMRTAKKIQAAEVRAETAEKAAERKTAEANEKISAAGTAKPDDPGLLRIKNNNGRYALEMDGALITDALSLDKKKRLIELITVFRPYLEGGQPSQAAPQSNAPIHTPPQPASVQAADFSLPPLPEVKPLDDKAIRALSIVAQIDTVLQKKLVDTPLAEKRIRLTQSSIGGVEVYVGASKYPSIDDVPDTAIKSVIREAVAEWEQKYTPGM
jgi:hypothetical protein